jgi:hypothetical protein
MWIVRVSAWGTAVFSVTSVVATVWSAMLAVALAVDLALFAAGCLALLGGYLRAIERSRRESISLNGLFFLGDAVAPPPVVRNLRLLLAAQVVVALVTAGIRPFTALAFGVLVPTFGLGMMALWAAIYGRFGPREEISG